MDDEPEVTRTAAEMAAAMGMTPTELQRGIAEVSRRPRVLVAPENLGFGRWLAQCGQVGTGVRESALTLAHQHNETAHASVGAVRALNG